jgi:hypothetical protein
MFSEKALKAQEPLITGYVNKLISRLHEQVEKPQTATLDLLKWYNYTTFDVSSIAIPEFLPRKFGFVLREGADRVTKILGDLAFGDSFGCLDSDILQ